ncbi:MAG: hypothetical protein QXS19_06510 [Candidatus Methanomethylicia archaeon]
MKKKFMTTIFLIHSAPTVIFTIYKFDISIFNAIAVRCLFDCLLMPTLAYYILRIFLPSKYLEFQVIKRFNEDKLEIYMHLYIITIISISFAITRVKYIFIPIEIEFLQDLAIFQLKIYTLLALTGFISMQILDRTE